MNYRQRALRNALFIISLYNMKTMYIIPGLNENTQDSRYQKLGEIAEEKKYTVVFLQPNWKKSLSSQKFTIKQNDIIFGFSLGALFA